MEKRKIVTYDEISTHFKRRLALKYRMDKTLIDVETKQGNSKAIEIWYWCVNYAVLVNDRILGIIEWNSCQEDDFEEEIDRDFHNLSSDRYPEDIDDFFYS